MRATNHRNRKSRIYHVIIIQIRSQRHSDAAAVMQVYGSMSRCVCSMSTDATRDQLINIHSVRFGFMRPREVSRGKCLCWEYANQTYRPRTLRFGIDARLGRTYHLYVFTGGIMSSGVRPVCDSACLSRCPNCNDVTQTGRKVTHVRQQFLILQFFWCVNIKTCWHRREHSWRGIVGLFLRHQ